MKTRIRPGEHMLPCSRFRSFDNARRNDRATAMDESLDLSPTVSEEVDTEEVDMEEGDVGEEEPTTAMDESLDLSPTVSEELEMADEPLEQESFCPANTFEGLGASISISTNIHILSIHYAGIGQNVAMAQYLVYLHTRPIIHDKHAQAWDRHPSGPHCGFPVIKNDEAGVGAAKKKKTKRDLSHRSAMKKSARQVAHKWEPHPVEILIRAFCLLHDLGQALGIVPSESPAGQALDTIAEVQRLKGALEEVVRRTEAIEKE
ncbi:hypothetical protein Q9189_005424 [Teloschistes chrysophthalmus]